jgi:Skp family chaperone for outer membrane proteins
MIQTGLLAAALLASCSGALAADPKIGIVDMRKVFDNYYKTVQANTAISNEVADMQKSLNTMLAQADKIREAGQKAEAGANDQSIPAEEREKNRKLAQEKADELRTTQSGIQEYNEREQNRLAEKKRRLTDTIVGEILARLKEMSKAAGYTLALDKSGEAIPGVPIVLYTDGENDLTDALLKDLNAGAPATPAADTKPSIPPPDSKLLPTGVGR